ncbi:phospholipid metabolism enzyme regulator, putative [Trichophyton verrucosum HKI 0517]|uniref:Phospholipid metabolism enzyme regulator, putative n=1 Tax=Trichophyton verrucosum (strain HKI 0517) TaxID=663202 RepID=D4D131_TRIVH|nr:phospholipid metabolism enzyme regulator, putative [Trichophyton verrucosum HKI 0517]EFE44429.1 phospholipid metabolism enzyme regulator, putative [Trichophyton verrucosum HKI 0517]
MSSSTSRLSSPSRPTPAVPSHDDTVRQDAHTSAGPEGRTSTNGNGAGSAREQQSQFRATSLLPPTILHPSTAPASIDPSLRPKPFHLHHGRPLHMSSSPNSVNSSRETSPIPRIPRSAIAQPAAHSSASTSRSISRSRKGSRDLSIPRSPSGAAAVSSSQTQSQSQNGHKQLADVNKPLLPPPVDTLGRLSPISPSFTNKPIDSPSQRSPGLKSPQPQSNLSSFSLPDSVPESARLPNQEKDSRCQQQQQSSQQQQQQQSEKQTEDSEDNQMRSISRNLSRTGSVAGSMLETVEEAGTPTPTDTHTTLDSKLDEKERGKDDTSSKPGGESGSDSSGKKRMARRPSDPHRRNPSVTARPNAGDVLPKRSFTSLSSARGKPGEISMTNMTVETETVSSVPQVPLGGPATERGGTGTLRERRSDETIRPKKEKKKASRKTTVPPGGMSSKADIFEAKVASAVDDADSSDSAETFVYESNPRDPHPARQHRYHSRTPSTASAVSQLDQYGGRTRSALRDTPGFHGISGKRSMKFTNNTYNTFDGDDTMSSGRGSSRINGHNIHTTRHHTGRHARNGANTSLFDHARFFSSQQVPTSKGFRYLSVNGNSAPHRLSAKQDGDYGYDFDAEGADDERTPLVNGPNGRNIRSRHGRRPGSSSLRQLEYMEERRRGWFARATLCTLLLVLVIILGAGTAVFVVGVTKTLTNVQIRGIQNVLASEALLMMDLDVQAVNPNLFTLTVNHLDVNIFAKSKFLEVEEMDLGETRLLPRTGDSKSRAILSLAARGFDVEAEQRQRAEGNVDKGTDPIHDPSAPNPQTMLLGRVFHLDSPLTFTPSPWKHLASNSTAQIRVPKPGNRTEEGGSLRWEKIQQHPFELIVRGVVRYELPLSSIIQSAPVSAKVAVLPDKGNAKPTSTSTLTPTAPTKTVTAKAVTETSTSLVMPTLLP